MRNFLCSMVMFAACSAYGSIIYDDNQTHTIDHLVEGFTDVCNSTVVNIVSPANVNLGLFDNSTANITGGLIRAMLTEGSSTAYITGGDFRGPADYIFSGDSTIHVRGGLFSSDEGGSSTPDTAVVENAKMIFYGTDFSHTTRTIFGADYTFISGTLENGDVLDNFGVYVGPDTSIQFVPEPATLLMLGLGGVLLRRRRAA